MVAPRKRPPTSRSPSPKRTPRQPDGDKFDDLRRELDLRQSGKERENGQPTATKPVTEEHKQAAAKYEYEKLLTMRSGGTYIPPAKLRALQAQITDKSSKEYQRMVWEALKKSINGLINKVNTANIKHIVPELFNENLVRGRGLFCRSIMKAQAASLPFTPIYAAMAAIVNTKLPAVGELLVNRLTVQFRKAYKRNDKATSLSSTTFIAHLVNHQVVTEMLAAEILLLLLQNPSDDSVEIAVGLMRNVGKQLEEQNPKIDMGVFEQFRTILHEGDIDKRTQYMIEVLMKVRKDRYKDDPPIKEELDLVEEEDQITHQVELMGNLDTEDGLNVFKYDPNWEENENAYKKTKAEILGEAEGSDEDEEYETESSSEDEDEKQEREMEIKDQSNADLSNLRKKIYLTIKSSGGFEEACHKLMRVNLPAGQEGELPSMIVQCAAQEQTYQKFYGLMAERFCKLNRLWMDLFEAEFIRQHETIHRLSEKEIRITAQLFAHLFAEDAINFSALSCVRVNEDDSNASTRIFLKILLKEIQESISMNKLKEKLMAQGEELEGMFPKDEPRNTRFATNFYTAIGMGEITDDMRQHLENLPKPALPQAAHPESDSGSESRLSYSSYSSRSRTASLSPSRSRSYSPSRSRSPVRSSRRRQDRSYSSSYSSRSPSYSRSLSRSPPPRRGRARTRSTSSTSSHSYSSSISRSPSPRPRGHRGARSPDSRSPSSLRSRSWSSRGYRRRRSPSVDSRSPSPPPRRRGRRYTSSPEPADSPSQRRNPPLPASRRRSRSPRRRASSSVSRIRSRSVSASPPPRRRQLPRSRRPVGYRRRSPPPPPPTARAGDRRDDRRGGRSPPPPPGRGGAVRTRNWSPGPSRRVGSPRRGRRYPSQSPPRRRR